MAGAVYLSDLLRPRGVPLPELLAHDTHAERPCLVLERLAGADLGDAINDLSDQQCDEIARRVAQPPLVASKVGPAGRYGYAVLAEQAPYTGWTQVLDAHFARSRSRIMSAGLFNVGHIESMEAMLTTMRDRVDAVAPTPFLHDTTTKNVIVTTEGVLSGIVDVDELCFGDPRYPAALTLAALTGGGGSARYISSWMRHAG